MTIVIAGGSGYIGTLLSKKLLSLGNRVVVVDIKAPSITHSELFFIQCDITLNPLPYDVLEKTDVVINLAGRPIATKWTEKNKKEIRDSRIKSTKHIIDTIDNTKNKPSCFICASAIGFYGDTGNQDCDESCDKGSGFLSGVVEDWEKVAEKATEYGVRTVCIRTAPVLGHGGFLSEITRSAKFGFLLKMKKQDFWMSWIHEEDIVNIYIFAIETSTLQGVVNACSPEQIKHSSFMKSLGFAIHRRVIGTLPNFIAKKIFGEFLDEITKNQKVIPKRLLDKGFVFLYPNLSSALNKIFKK